MSYLCSIGVSPWSDHDPADDRHPNHRATDPASAAGLRATVRPLPLLGRLPCVGPADGWRVAGHPAYTHYVPPERRRARTNEEPDHEPEPVRASAVPDPGLAGTLLSCQATGGNQMVVRLLESARSAALPGDDLAGRIRTRLGGGQPLPTSVRTDVETGLGQRLGDVRLHTDAPAATFASELNAHAFTTGNDIFFNAGVYDPATTNGYATLAHELTHTLQQ